MSARATDLTIRKAITVPVPPAEAFEAFTGRIGSWWPLATHSLGGERAATVVIEGRVDGRVYELTDGEERDWGRVLAWEPPHRLVLEWHVNRDRPAPTEVEVRFSAEGDGTRVELEHRAWERLGEQASEASEGYRGGWDVVLGRYVASVH